MRLAGAAQTVWSVDRDPPSGLSSAAAPCGGSGSGSAGVGRKQGRPSADLAALLSLTFFLRSSHINSPGEHLHCSRRKNTESLEPRVSKQGYQEAQ